MIGFLSKLREWFWRTRWAIRIRTSILSHKYAALKRRVKGWMPEPNGSKYKLALQDIKTGLQAYEDDLNDVAHQGRDKLEPDGEDYSRLFMLVSIALEEALK